MTAALLDVLRCPRCAAPFLSPADLARVERLRCSDCPFEAPVVHGIPRFVELPADEEARRTQASFGYEWTHFHDPNHSGTTNFNDYFDGIDLAALRGQLVLDAGCGMGRHARQIAAHAGHVVAIDFSRAIEQAARNTREAGNVECLQADLLALPLAPGTFDFVYSLGVLHHLSETERALKALIDRLKPGGRLRIYLYWKKHGWQGTILRAVTLVRALTTRLPFPLLRLCSWLLSVLLYGAVIVPYRAVSRIGATLHESWPLFVYTKYPFRVLYNDQFDRFSAPIEKRYDEHEVAALLTSLGLVSVRVRPCYGWVADGTRPS